MAYNYQYPTQPQQYRPAYPTAWNNSQSTPAAPQVRPVSSLEEVRACPIDFDGSIFYFTDVANKRIYTKQIGLDGSAIINLYEQKEIQTPVQPIVQNGNYVTKEEFNETIASLLEKFNTLTSPQQEEKKKPAFEI